MSQIDLLPQVKQLLEQATSQDPVAIKSAEANLAACAEKWRIVPSLAQVYGDLTLAPQIRLGKLNKQIRKVNNTIISRHSSIEACA